MPPSPDYYEILQVHPKASLAVIKKAYRTLLMELGHHPDRGGDPSIAAQITEAYEVLGDPVRRAEYDRYYFSRTPPPASGRSPSANKGVPSHSPASEAANSGVTAGSTLIVLCPRCHTRNRVRGQEVLNIAKCSRCGQKLSQMPRAIDVWGDRARTYWHSLIRPEVTGPRSETDSKRLLAAAVGLLVVAGGATVALLGLPANLGFDPVERARELVEEQKVDEARLVLADAAKHDPDNALIFERLGELMLDEKKYPEAAAAFGRAAQLNPQSAFYRAREGRSFYLMGDYVSAEAAYRDATALDPDHAPALFDLGNIAARRSDFQAAASYYERAGRIEPRADLYYNLGLVQQQAKQPAMAIAALEMATRLDPKHQAAQAKLKELSVKNKKDGGKIGPTSQPVLKRVVLDRINRGDNGVPQPPQIGSKSHSPIPASSSSGRSP